MLSHSYLLAVIFISIQGSCGETVMNQTPASLSVSPGQTATFTCTSSTSTGNSIAWYQQKSGKSPALLMYSATTRHTGVPDRFTGSTDGSPYTRYTLTINGVTKEDEATYYCLQVASFPFTFGQGTFMEVTGGADSKPSVSIFPASKEQIPSGSASSVCLLNNFYPRDATVTWKVDNNVISEGVLNSDKVKDTNDGTYSMSSTLTLAADKYKSYGVIACEVTHKTLTSALVSSFKVSECSV